MLFSKMLERTRKRNGKKFSSPLPFPRQPALSMLTVQVRPFFSESQWMIYFKQLMPKFQCKLSVRSITELQKLFQHNYKICSTYRREDHVFWKYKQMGISFAYFTDTQGYDADQWFLTWGAHPPPPEGERCPFWQCVTCWIFFTSLRFFYFNGFW